MAAVFTFDPKEARRDPKYPKTPKAVGKLEQALAAKKVPKAKSDDFVKKLQAYNFSPITSEANRYIMKNLKGKDLVPIPTSKMEKAAVVVLLGPQAMVLSAKFALSVHIKGQSLELWSTDCKGTTTTLFSA